MLSWKNVSLNVVLSLMTRLYLFQGTQGYSGSDIRLVCKEAAMRPVRKIFNALESHQDGRTTQTHTHSPYKKKKKKKMINPQISHVFC